MNATPNAGSPTGRVWEQIQQEKKRDKMLMRFCIGAWTATLIVVLGALVLVGFQAKVFFGSEGFMGGGGSVSVLALAGALMPVISMLWNLCLLVAALTTLGVFLRFRSANLAEIQMRLASLEEMLANRS
jgi:hypothetical protein